MITHIIINADDFGLTQGINKGIIEGFTQGLISSTTVMMNMPYANEILNTSLSSGVHLNITIGKPLTNGQSFIKDGYFKSPKDYSDQVEVDEQELYDEWKAQIEAYISLTGHKPTHLDTHHNIHLLYPQVYQQLALEYHLPIRQLNTHPSIPCFHFKDTCTLDAFKQACYNHQGILEIMTHPGYSDESLKEISSYHQPRETELMFWLNPEVKQFLQTHHINVISYQDIDSISHE